MTDKHTPKGTLPPLHRDANAQDRPVPKRTWGHARYGDAPEPNKPGRGQSEPQDQTFSEAADAARTGDTGPGKH